VAQLMRGQVDRDVRLRQPRAPERHPAGVAASSVEASRHDLKAAVDLPTPIDLLALELADLCALHGLGIPAHVQITIEQGGLHVAADGLPAALANDLAGELAARQDGADVLTLSDDGTFLVDIADASDRLVRARRCHIDDIVGASMAMLAARHRDQLFGSVLRVPVDVTAQVRSAGLFGLLDVIGEDLTRLLRTSTARAVAPQAANGGLLFVFEPQIGSDDDWYGQLDQPTRAAIDAVATLGKHAGRMLPDLHATGRPDDWIDLPDPITPDCRMDMFGVDERIAAHEVRGIAATVALGLASELGRLNALQADADGLFEGEDLGQRDLLLELDAGRLQDATIPQRYRGKTVGRLRLLLDPFEPAWERLLSLLPASTGTLDLGGFVDDPVARDQLDTALGLRRPRPPASARARDAAARAITVLVGDPAEAASLVAAQLAGRLDEAGPLTSILPTLRPIINDAATGHASAPSVASLLAVLAPDHGCVTTGSLLLLSDPARRHYVAVDDACWTSAHHFERTDRGLQLRRAGDPTLLDADGTDPLTAATLLLKMLHER